MIGKVGERIVVESEQVGQSPREGEILAVELAPSGPHYRVRWTDGHESFFIPEAGNARIIPAPRSKGRRRSA
jgi:hypothetical protein